MEGSGQTQICQAAKLDSIFLLSQWGKGQDVVGTVSFGQVSGNADKEQEGPGLGLVTFSLSSSLYLSLFPALALSIPLNDLTLYGDPRRDKQIDGILDKVISLQMSSIQAELDLAGVTFLCHEFCTGELSSLYSEKTIKLFSAWEQTSSMVNKTLRAGAGRPHSHPVLAAVLSLGLRVRKGDVAAGEGRQAGSGLESKQLDRPPGLYGCRY